MKKVFHHLTTPLYGQMLAFDCADWLANGHNDIFKQTAKLHEHNQALAHVWPRAVTKGADRLLAKGWWEYFVGMTSWLADKPALMAGVNSGHIHDACAQMPKRGAERDFIKLCQNISYRPDLMDSLIPSQVHRAAKSLLQAEWGSHATYLIQPLQAAVADYPALTGAINRVPETERMATYSAAQTYNGWPLLALANPKTNQVDFFVPHDGRQSIKQLFDRCYMYPRNCCGYLVVFQALDELAGKPAAATAAKQALNSLAHWNKHEHCKWVLGRDYDKVSAILQRHVQPVAA